MAKFRSKVGLAVVGLGLLICVAFYLVLIRPWAGAVQQQAQADVKRAANLARQLQRLQSYREVRLATRIAATPGFAKALQVEEESARRKAVFAAIGDFDAKLRAKGHKADFFGVLDKQGRVIARDLDIHHMHGEKLPFPSVKLALAGKAVGDVWLMKNRMMHAGVAPIQVDGNVAGAVVIAYDFTAAEARKESNNMGADVAYFVGGAIRASSLFSAAGEAGAKLKAAGEKLLASGSPVNKSISAGKRSDIFTVKIGEDLHLVQGAPLPSGVDIIGLELTSRIEPSGATAESIAGARKYRAGYVVLVNLDERMAAVSKARWIFGGFTIVLLLLLLVAMYAVARHFVNAEDRLELGVSEIISGNMDYVFEATEEFEGLANALNVMLARLLGRPEPGDEEEGEEAWRADVLHIDEETPPPPGVDPAALAAEPEEAYYARIHQEYVAARREAQLPIDGITVPNLSQKLRANEAMLKAKHKCSMVRFVVDSSAGRVSLKPVIIR